LVTFVIKLLINVIIYIKIPAAINFRLIITVNQLGTLATSTGLQDKFGEITEYS